MTLFDHLVGAQQEAVRHVDSDRFGCFEIDHQLEFCRLFDRNVGGLRALQQSDASVC
jgi:hypothetical protein